MVLVVGTSTGALEHVNVCSTIKHTCVYGTVDNPCRSNADDKRHVLDDIRWHYEGLSSLSKAYDKRLLTHANHISDLRIECLRIKCQNVWMESAQYPQINRGYSCERRLASEN